MSIIVRKAEAKDYEGVVNIGTFYYGTDYMAATFHKNLKSYHCFVALIDDEIVGFHSGKIVDEGKTIMTTGARVKKSVQGQGILSRILKYMINYFKTNVPTVQYEAMAIEEENKVNNGQRILKSYQLLVEKVVMEYVCNTVELDISHLSTGTKDINSLGGNLLNREDLQLIFQCPDTCSRLLPEGRLLLNWRPYRPLLGNIPFLLERNIFRATKNNDDYTSLVAISTYRCGDKDENICYQIEVYGNRISEIKDHIIYHIHQINTNYKSLAKLVYIHLFYSMECNKYDKQFLSVIEDCGFKLTDQNFAPRKLYSFEKNI